MRSNDNHLWMISLEIPQLSLAKINLKITLVKIRSKLPRCQWVQFLFQIHVVGELLKILPQQSSVVVTAASILLNELFTHHGEGHWFIPCAPVGWRILLCSVLSVCPSVCSIVCWSSLCLFVYHFVCHDITTLYHTIFSMSHWHFPWSLALS